MKLYDTLPLEITLENDESKVEEEDLSSTFSEDPDFEKKKTIMSKMIKNR
jgi:hypothetical protein